MNQIQSFMYNHNDLMFVLKIMLVVAILIIIVGVIFNYVYTSEINFLDTLSCSQILNKINLSGEHRHESIINYYVDRCVN